MAEHRTKRPQRRVIRRGLGTAAIASTALAVLGGTASAEIAFDSFRCDQGGEPVPTPDQICAGSIFRIRDDGTGMTRLTTGASEGEEPLSGDRQPKWSPDGTQIAFMRQTHDSSMSWRVFVMGADGSNQRRLHPSFPNGYDSEDPPAWSPDGELMAFPAFASDPVPGEELDDRPLILMNADGSDPRRVSPEGWAAAAPEFTPDGTAITYVGIPDPDRGEYNYIDGETAVYRTDLDGGNTTRISFGDIPLRADAISPDGSLVAFGLQSRFYTMRIDGSDLTARAEMIAENAHWSPSGPTVFFTGYPEPAHFGGSAIFKIDMSDPGEPVQVTTPLSYDGFSDWAAVAQEAPEPAERKDRVPPAVVTASQLRRRDSSGSHAKSKQSKRSRIPFVVVDASGIRRVSASVGRRADGRCRFLRGSKLRARKRCSKPRFFRVRNATGWRKQTSDLPKGTYVVHFRTTDVKGHTTKHPKRRIVRVK